MIPYATITAGDGTAVLRPLVDVLIGPVGIPHTCLIDSGAIGIRMSRDLALGAGLVLATEPNAGDIQIAGIRSQVYAATVDLRLRVDGAELDWRAEVAFCDPWPHPFGLLGTRGFFDALAVSFQPRPLGFAIRRP